MTAKDNDPWKPTSYRERCENMDVLRGLALFGVLIVNLHSDFRVSLAEDILQFHMQAGRANYVADELIAGLLEFKAITIFSLLFGAGLGIFAERAGANGVSGSRFLARRLGVLLLFGLCHLLLIWNGDILTLYAVAGFLLIPLLRLRTPSLMIAATVGITLSFVPWSFWPVESTLRSVSLLAQSAYTTGSFQNVLSFHFYETRVLILPLLAGTLPKTLGLMALGCTMQRNDIFRQPEKRLSLLITITIVGGLIGGLDTFKEVLSKSTGQSANVPPLLLEIGSYLPLAFAYTTGLILMLRSRRLARFASPFAALGQMALTNYLIQSVLLSLLFYGYGFGLYGRLGSFRAALVGIAIYLGQMAISMLWLRHYRFGPAEWLWRSLTYGRPQPMRRHSHPEQTFLST